MVVDGASSEVDAMIAETGVGTFVHLTGAEASALAGEYGVSAIPFFAFIDGDGGTDTMVGWSAGQFEGKLAQLRS